MSTGCDVQAFVSESPSDGNGFEGSSRPGRFQRHLIVDFELGWVLNAGGNEVDRLGIVEPASFCGCGSFQIPA